MDVFEYPTFSEKEMCILDAMEGPWEINLSTYLTGQIAEDNHELDQAQLSTFELLPPELKLIILGYCDPQSVFNVFLTGPVFHRFVRMNEAQISRSILCREISPDLRCLAAARYRVDRYGFPVARHESGEPRTPGQKIFTADFMRHGLRDRKVWNARNSNGFYANFRFTLETAGQIVSFHHKVLHFAKIFSQDAIRKGPVSTRWWIDLPDYVVKPSPRELHRFTKALYIFDVASAILPLVLAVETTSLEYAMWHEFWEKFAPWEQEQVRCVQHMLQNWVDDSVSQQGGYLTIDPDFEVLAQFVIKLGLPGLMKLDLKKVGFIQDRIAEFQDVLRLDTLPPRKEVWMQGMEEFWLPRREDGEEINLDATDVLSRFPEEDSGPRDAWLHTLLENRIYDPIFGPGYFRLFSCEPCMSEWGFIFWDRAKLDWYAQGTMASAEDMLRVARDTWISRDLFKISSWGRQGGICPGCMWVKRIYFELGSVHYHH